MRVQVLAEELRPACFGSRAQELLQALSGVVGGTLLKTVRPAVDFDALVDAGLVHRLVGDELVRRCAIVELHKKRRAEHVSAVVGDEMAVADDALTEIFEVAVLLRHQGAPGGFHPRLVPAVDRPLRRLGAVVVLQCLALQTIARIARQIARRLFAWHVISPIRRLWMSLALVRIRAGQSQDGEGTRPGYPSTLLVGCPKQSRPHAGVLKTAGFEADIRACREGEGNDATVKLNPSYH